MNKTILLAYLRSQGFSKKTIDSFKKIDRSLFIPEKYKHLAYDNIALPLYEGVTISQPFTIAFMLDLLDLRKGQRVLEIGSGSGYVLALIESITKAKVFGIEVLKKLAEKSKKLLKDNKNIKIICNNGKLGFPEQAPFHRILISAAAREKPKHLKDQLVEDGIIVASVKDTIVQMKKHKNKILTKEFPGFIFVPLKD